jgi:hypothetical protein
VSETVTVLSSRMYADMVGKPFRRGARGPDEYDCWGVLQAILRRMGHSPTDYPTSPELVLQVIADEWEPIRIDQLLPGDGILLRSTDPAYEWHIGVAVDPWNMLHAREGAGVCVERIEGPAYKRRLLGFYRYRGRA